MPLFYVRVRDSGAEPVDLNHISEFAAFQSNSPEAAAKGFIRKHFLGDGPREYQVEVKDHGIWKIEAELRIASTKAKEVLYRFKGEMLHPVLTGINFEKLINSLCENLGMLAQHPTPESIELGAPNVIRLYSIKDIKMTDGIIGPCIDVDAKGYTLLVSHMHQDTEEKIDEILQGFNILFAKEAP